MRDKDAILQGFTDDELKAEVARREKRWAAQRERDIDDELITQNIGALLKILEAFDGSTNLYDANLYYTLLQANQNYRWDSNFTIELKLVARKPLNAN